MRSGYTLKAEGSTRHFFATYVRGDLQYVEDQNYAWFTESRDRALAAYLLGGSEAARLVLEGA